MKKIYLITLFLAIFIQVNAGFNVGVACKVITPDTAIWLSGYASRNKPSTGILHDLWAKALVIEEDGDIRIIIVTIDMIYYGLPGPFTGNIEEKVFSAIDIVMKKTDAKPYKRK